MTNNNCNVATQGENNRHAKLTEEKVKHIRSIPFTVSHYEVAALYPSVKYEAIRLIRIKQTWKHVK